MSQPQRPKTRITMSTGGSTSSKLCKSDSTTTPPTKSPQVKTPSAPLTTTNAYMEKVRLKRKKNNRRLEDLGIGEKFELVRRQKLRNNKKRIKKKDCTPPNLTPARRSARQKHKPVQYTAIDAIEDAGRLRTLTIAERKRTHSTSSSKTIKRKKLRELINVAELSTAALGELRNINAEDWLYDMRRYLAEDQGGSVNNVTRVMLVVRKLVEGVGVQHPFTKKIFMKNEKIHLGCNFQAMRNDASEWVDSNGGDRGNGWLIEHPMKKLVIYQMARVEHGRAFFSDNQV